MSKSQKTENFSQQLISTIVSQAQQVNFKQVFSTMVHRILQVFAQKKGISIEFFLPALLCGIGFYLSESTIQSFPESFDTPCIFTALIAFASTGKSGAMSFIKTAVSTIERWLGIQDNNSQLSQTPTVESLLDLLSRLRTIIAFYDEGGTFFGALGRYGGNSLYDRAIYLTLWCAINQIERDLKNDRTKIEQPRFQLSLNTHPVTIINLLYSEKTTADEGFSHRFLIACPNPADFSAEQLRNAPENILSLVSIFLFLKMSHSKHPNYTFEPDSLPIIDHQFDKYKRYVKAAHGFDSFIGGLCGKMYTHLIRLAMILKALNEACTLIKDAPNSKLDKITKEFEDACEQIILNLPNNTYIIEPMIVNQAIDLLNYFQLHKLILAQYTIDTSLDFEQNIEAMISENELKPKVSGPFLNENVTTIRIMKRVLYYPSHAPSTNDISVGNFIAADVEKVFKKLQEQNLGTITRTKARNSKVFSSFNKVTLAEIENNKLIGDTIQHLSIDLKHYIEHLVQLEITGQNINNKRSREDDLTDISTIPESKKPKTDKTYKVKILGQKYGLPLLLDIEKIPIKKPISVVATNVGYDESIKNKQQPKTTLRKQDKQLSVKAIRNHQFNNSTVTSKDFGQFNISRPASKINTKSIDTSQRNSKNKTSSPTNIVTQIVNKTISQEHEELKEKKRFNFKKQSAVFQFEDEVTNNELDELLEETIDRRSDEERERDSEEEQAKDSVDEQDRDSDEEQARESDEQQASESNEEQEKESEREIESCTEEEPLNTQSSDELVPDLSQLPIKNSKTSKKTELIEKNSKKSINQSQPNIKTKPTKSIRIETQAAKLHNLISKQENTTNKRLNDQASTPVLEPAITKTKYKKKTVEIDQQSDTVPRDFNSQSMRGERSTPRRQAADNASQNIASMSNKHRNSKSKPVERIANI